MSAKSSAKKSSPWKKLPAELQMAVMDQYTTGLKKRNPPLYMIAVYVNSDASGEMGVKILSVSTDKKYAVARAKELAIDRYGKGNIVKDMDFDHAGFEPRYLEFGNKNIVEYSHIRGEGLIFQVIEFNG
jgi:hypothetical protein